MKQIHLTAILCIGVAAFAQEARFDYEKTMTKLFKNYPPGVGKPE
jgi:hypothetical protein